MRKQNLEAFRALVEEYKERAVNAAMRMVGNQQDALELSQEAFAKAFFAFDRFDASRSFYTWFYRILANTCTSFLRKKVRAARHIRKRIPLEGVANPRPADPGAIAERDEQKRALWAAITRLHAPYRDVIVLRHFEELSYREIADVLECPIGTVMSRLFDARRQLRMELEGRGI